MALRGILKSRSTLLIDLLGWTLMHVSIICCTFDEVAGQPQPCLLSTQNGLKIFNAYENNIVHWGLCTMSSSKIPLCQNNRRCLNKLTDTVCLLSYRKGQNFQLLQFLVYLLEDRAIDIQKPTKQKFTTHLLGILGMKNLHLATTRYKQSKYVRSLLDSTQMQTTPPKFQTYFVSDYFFLSSVSILLVAPLVLR